MKPEATLKAIRSALKIWAEDKSSEEEVLIRIIQLVEQAGFPLIDPRDELIE